MFTRQKRFRLFIIGVFMLGIAVVVSGCGGGGGGDGGRGAVNYHYYVGSDGANGWELWRSDGTSAGTFMIRDINPGSEDGYYGEW